MTNRVGGPLAAALVVLACAPAAIAPATAAPSGTDTRGLPAISYRGASAQTSLGDGDATVDLPIPGGLTARIVTARIRSSLTAGLQADLLVGGRVVADLAPGAHTVRAVVQPGDLEAVQGGSLLRITVRVVDPQRQWNRCSDPDQDVTVDDVTLALAGTALAPVSVATFFDSSVTDVVVDLPEASTVASLAGLAEAGLQAVASLVHRYGAAGSRTTAVHLVVGDSPEPSTSLGHRVLRLLPGTGAVSTDISTIAGVPTLTMTGAAAQLSSAVRTFDHDEIALGAAARTTGLTAATTPAAGLSQSFAQLGAGPSLRLAGYGESTASVGVHQAQFGGPISAADVHVVGTATPVPTQAQARLSVYWNGDLVAATAIRGGLAQPINLSFHVPPGQLQRDNGITLRLDALPDAGDCRTAGLPVEVDIAGSASTVTGSRGDSIDAGFLRFPQVLSGSLPVSFGSATASSRLVTQAAEYVTSLQGSTSVPLTVTTVPVSSFISGADRARSGLLVGSTAAQADQLQAPLRLAGFRRIDQPSGSFGVGLDTPFAALESFGSGSREVLLAGAWAPEGTTPAVALAMQERLAETTNSPGGWASLNKSLLVVSAAGSPVQLATTAIVPQASVIHEHSVLPQSLYYGVAAILLLGFVRWFAARRRQDRIRRYVDSEQLRHEADRRPPTRPDAVDGSP